MPAVLTAVNPAQRWLHSSHVISRTVMSTSVATGSGIAMFHAGLRRQQAAVTPARLRFPAALHGFHGAHTWALSAICKNFSSIANATVFPPVRHIDSNTFSVTP